MQELIQNDKPDTQLSLQPFQPLHRALADQSQAASSSLSL